MTTVTNGTLNFSLTDDATEAPLFKLPISELNAILAELTIPAIKSENTHLTENEIIELEKIMPSIDVEVKAEFTSDHCSPFCAREDAYPDSEDYEITDTFVYVTWGKNWRGCNIDRKGIREHFPTLLGYISDHLEEETDDPGNFNMDD